MKRLVLPIKLTALICCIVFLFGCSSSSKTNEKGAIKQDATSTTEGAQTKGGKPIVIGAPLPIGFLSGWDGQRGMTLAVEEINAKGGVKVGNEMRPLKLEVLDTRDLEPSVPISDALLTVEKLILEKKADFIVGGPNRSEAALAAMDLIAQNKKVFISSTGFLSPKFEQAVAGNPEKYKYCFRVSGSSKTMVAEMMAVFDQLKKDYGFDKAAIMVQDVAHARAGGDIMNTQLKNKGWKVMAPEIYPTGTMDYSTGLMKARKFGAQVIFIWTDMPEVSILLKQYVDMKIPALAYGFISTAEHPEYYKESNGKSEYTMVHMVNAANAPGQVTELTDGFFKAYTQRWKVEPEGYGTSSSYQAIYTLVDAIQRAGTLDPDAVIKALEETDMTGVYGRVRFNKTHQIIPSMDPKEGAVPQVIQWQNNKRVTVFPPSIATAKTQLPPWMNK